MTSITFFFLLVPVLGILLLAINFLFATHSPYQEKNSVFECGFHSFLGQNRMEFNISFYIFGLLFLLFDLEILLIYPFSVSSSFNEIYGLIVLLIFFSALTLGFVFELGKNALKIDSRQFEAINKTFKPKHILESKLFTTKKLISIFIIGSTALLFKALIYQCFKYNIFEDPTSLPSIVYTYILTGYGIFVNEFVNKLELGNFLTDRLFSKIPLGNTELKETKGLNIKNSTNVNISSFYSQPSPTNGTDGTDGTNGTNGTNDTNGTNGANYNDGNNRTSDYDRMIEQMALQAIQTPADSSRDIIVPHPNIGAELPSGRNSLGGWVPRNRVEQRARVPLDDDSMLTLARVQAIEDLNFNAIRNALPEAFDNNNQSNGNNDQNNGNNDQNNGNNDQNNGNNNQSNGYSNNNSNTEN